MALDALILGPFVFTDFSVPDRLPLGGRQQVVLHKLPGGDRVADAMGPDDDDRTWTGILWGDDALDQALTLDAMRVSGEQLSYSNGVESRLVIISSFQPKVEKFTCVEYSITVTPLDNPSGGNGGAGGMIFALADMVLSDIAAAVGFL